MSPLVVPGRATRPTSPWAISSPAPPCSALMPVRWKALIAPNTTRSLASINKGLPARSSPRLVIALRPTSLPQRPRYASRKNKFSLTFESNFNTEDPPQNIMIHLNQLRLKSMKKLLGIYQSTSNVALISVVDDDRSVVEAIVSLLESVGYTAAGFVSAQEFLNSPPLRRTACLLLDVVCRASAALSCSDI